MCTPNCPGTHNNPASDTQVLRLQACAKIPSSIFFLLPKKKRKYLKYGKLSWIPNSPNQLRLLKRQLQKNIL